jgi:hypothetical protein
MSNGSTLCCFASKLLQCCEKALWFRVRTDSGLPFKGPAKIQLLKGTWHVPFSLLVKVFLTGRETLHGLYSVFNNSVMTPALELSVDDHTLYNWLFSLFASNYHIYWRYCLAVMAARQLIRRSQICQVHVQLYGSFAFILREVSRQWLRWT